MNHYKKMVNLILKLLSSTQKGTLKWESIQDRNEFFVLIGDDGVIIGSRPSKLQSDYDEYVNDYYLKIMNKERIIVDEIDDIELSRAIKDDVITMAEVQNMLGSRNLFKVMEELFLDARRSANNTISIIDSILNSLQ